MTFSFPTGKQQALGRNLQAEIVSASIINAKKLVVTGSSSGTSIGVQEEGTDVTNSPFTTLNFVGSTITASDGGSGVATVTVAAPPAADLDSVLTAGDDANSQNITDLGELTFNVGTGTAKGIRVGTVTASATCSNTTSIVIGQGAYHDADQPNVIVIGTSAYASASLNGGAADRPARSIAVGYLAYVEQSDAVAIGSYAAVGTGSPPSVGTRGVAIGTNSDCQGVDSIAIGNGAYTYQTDAISIGRLASTYTRGIAIGATSSNSNGDGVAVGHAASAAANAIAIGRAAVASGSGGTCVGRSSTCGTGVALGYSADSLLDGVAIGRSTAANHNDAVVIGNNISSTAVNHLLLGNETKNFGTFFVTNGSAGAITTYLEVTVNGTAYKMPLYALA